MLSCCHLSGGDLRAGREGAAIPSERDELLQGHGEHVAVRCWRASRGDGGGSEVRESKPRR